MKYETLREFAQAGGRARVKQRFAGMSKEQISDEMRKVRRGKKKQEQVGEVQETAKQ